MAALGARNNPTAEQIRAAAQSYNGQISFDVGGGIRNPDPVQFTTVQQLYADQVVNLTQALTSSFTTDAAAPASTTPASTTPASTAPSSANISPPATPGCAPTAGIIVNGVQLTIPANTNVDPAVAGQTITAPTAAMARGLAAAFADIGVPYVYGGGTNDGPPDEGCARAGGESNSCQGIIGLDCSGLTGYALAQAGFHIPDNSQAQRNAGTPIPWDQGQPGDIIGYKGHVAIYLGPINGKPYLLEAPDVGKFVQIRTVYYSNDGEPVDNVLHRYWG